MDWDRDGTLTQPQGKNFPGLLTYTKPTCTRRGVNFDTYDKCLTLNSSSFSEKSATYLLPDTSDLCPITVPITDISSLSSTSTSGTRRLVIGSSDNSIVIGEVFQEFGAFTDKSEIIYYAEVQYSPTAVVLSVFSLVLVLFGGLAFILVRWEWEDRRRVRRYLHTDLKKYGKNENTPLLRQINAIVDSVNIKELLGERQQNIYGTAAQSKHRPRPHLDLADMLVGKGSGDGGDSEGEDKDDAGDGNGAPVVLAIQAVDVDGNLNGNGKDNTQRTSQAAITTALTVYLDDDNDDDDDDDNGTSNSASDSTKGKGKRNHLAVDLNLDENENDDDNDDNDDVAKDSIDIIPETKAKAKTQGSPHGSPAIKAWYLRSKMRIELDGSGSESEISSSDDEQYRLSSGDEDSSDDGNEVLHTKQTKTKNDKDAKPSIEQASARDEESMQEDEDDDEDEEEEDHKLHLVSHDRFDEEERTKLDSFLKQTMHLNTGTRKRKTYFDTIGLRSVIPLHEYTKMFSSVRSFVHSRIHSYLLSTSRILLMMLLVTLFYSTIFPSDYECERKVNSSTDAFDSSFLAVNQTREEKCAIGEVLYLSSIYNIEKECQWNSAEQTCTRRPPPDFYLFYLVVSLFVAISAGT